MSNPYLIPLRPRPASQQQPKRAEARILMINGNDYGAVSENDGAAARLRLAQQQQQQQVARASFAAIMNEDDNNLPKRDLSHLNIAPVVVRYAAEQQQPPPAAAPSARATSRGRCGSVGGTTTVSGANKNNNANSRSQPMFPSSAAAAQAVHRSMQQQQQQPYHQQTSSSSAHQNQYVGPTARNSCADMLVHHMIRKEVEACEDAAKRMKLPANFNSRSEQQEEQGEGSNSAAVALFADISPPASDDASRRLAFMIEQQRAELNDIQHMHEQAHQRQQLQHQQPANNNNMRSGSPNPVAPPPRNNNNNNNNNKNKSNGSSRQDQLLPATFVPVPPNRWRFPPQLPARRLVADGPRLALLETLEELAAEERRKREHQQRNRGGDGDGGAAARFSTAGSRVPSDLWVAIFEFLDPRELCRCSEVSRVWLCIARSEFLWAPILRVTFAGLIDESESEERFEARVNSISLIDGQQQQQQQQQQQETRQRPLLFPAPPRAQGQQQQREQQHAEDGDDELDYLAMCPSLERISTFVSHHRGRIRGQLHEAESRLRATQTRIEETWQQRQQQSTIAGTSSSASAPSASTRGNTNATNNFINSDISALERTVTNERNVLLRQLQALEPRLNEMLSRLREAESAHVQQSRSLNEAIVSAKRSSLQLDSMTRRALLAERRARDHAALDELERRVCQLVLRSHHCASNGTSSSSANQLPVALRKSVRTFSQLELILLSCCPEVTGGPSATAAAAFLAELPKRWQRAKAVLSLEALEHMRRDIDFCNDLRGVLESKLVGAASSTSASAAMTTAGARANNSVAPGAAMAAPPTSARLATDALFGSNRAPRVDRSTSGVSTSAATAARLAPSSIAVAPSFTDETMATRQRLIAEMCCGMSDEALEKYLSM